MHTGRYCKDGLFRQVNKMTREEAIGHIKDVICENNSIKPNIVVFEQEKEALYMAIKALKQYGALQEIRMEISNIVIEKERHDDLAIIKSPNQIKEECLKIIDKRIKEIEGSDAE